ncbi:hypothetical protein GCM10010358_47600 [Streptomyces minutiscleroticus]|uniref:Uncharacterized protein n=1 Tax=Streptomyces minutiscleroticus TaxID=68238 RepID=A0A918U401_9ACTN|nr:hypothetical protein GCM10010358_47600 [Streptomyces minutiscleroticus]
MLGTARDRTRSDGAALRPVKTRVVPFRPSCHIGRKLPAGPGAAPRPSRGGVPTRTGPAAPGPRAASALRADRTAGGCAARARAGTLCAERAHPLGLEHK